MTADNKNTNKNIPIPIIGVGDSLPLTAQADDVGVFTKKFRKDASLLQSLPCPLRAQLSFAAQMADEGEENDETCLHRQRMRQKARSDECQLCFLKFTPETSEVRRLKRGKNSAAQRRRRLIINNISIELFKE